MYYERPILPPWILLKLIWRGFYRIVISRLFLRIIWIFQMPKKQRSSQRFFFSPLKPNKSPLLKLKSPRVVYMKLSNTGTKYPLLIQNRQHSSSLSATMVGQLAGATKAEQILPTPHSAVLRLPGLHLHQPVGCSGNWNSQRVGAYSQLFSGLLCSPQAK